MSKEELINWAEKTINGWEQTAVSSHTKALANPSLIKAIREDIKHLKQIVALIKKDK